MNNSNSRTSNIITKTSILKIKQIFLEKKTTILKEEKCNLKNETQILKLKSKILRKIARNLHMQLLHYRGKRHQILNFKFKLMKTKFHK